jgi:hypothetical protein
MARHVYTEEYDFGFVIAMIKYMPLLCLEVINIVT